MNGRSDDEMVSYALEVDPALLPFVPDLLADLDVLGADLSLIVTALRELGVSEHSTVIDLGCGKGAVSIAIAAAFGCNVVGVDLFEPFVAIATAVAHRAGVGHRCRFVSGNIADLSATLPPADVVIYAALGDVLGPLDVTMAVIRQYAKVGGYVVINDCYLLDKAAATFPGFEHYSDLEQTRRQLVSCADDLILELAELESDDEQLDEAALLAMRATELAAQHPHLAAMFHEFARSQQDEYDFLDERTVSAVWALRRS